MLPSKFEWTKEQREEDERVMNSFFLSLERTSLLKTNAREILANSIVGFYYISIHKRTVDAYYKDVHKRWFGES